MDQLSSQDITQLLNAWRNGDNEAVQKLIPLVYEELHRLAARYMRREDPGHTLQTTALVNEAHCRLVDQKVELKFFGGLTTEEIAEVEKISIRTVAREWRKAKAWLYRAITTVIYEAAKMG